MEGFTTWSKGMPNNIQFAKKKKNEQQAIQILVTINNWKNLFKSNN